MTEPLWRRTFAYELKGFVNQYLTRALTEAGARDVGVAFETIIILLRQNVAERVVGEAEKQVVLPAHLAFKVVTYVRQGLARDGEDLGIAKVYQVELRGHTLRRRSGDAGQFLYEGTHQGRIHRKRESPCCTIELRRRLLRRVLDDAQSLIAQQPADALAFVPSPSLTTIGQAVVRGHHAALSAVHKDTRASAFRRNSVVKRPDQVGAANAPLAPYHLRMNCVIDQRRNWPATRIQGLNDMATRIIQLLCIMVVGYFP